MILIMGEHRDFEPVDITWWTIIARIR